MKTLEEYTMVKSFVRFTCILSLAVLDFHLLVWAYKTWRSFHG